MKSYNTKATKIGIDPTGIKFEKYYDSDIKLVSDFFSKKSYDSVEKRKAKEERTIKVFEKEKIQLFDQSSKSQLENINKQFIQNIRYQIDLFINIKLLHEYIKIFKNLNFDHWNLFGNWKLVDILNESITRNYSFGSPPDNFNSKFSFLNLSSSQLKIYMFFHFFNFFTFYGYFLLFCTQN
mgnify:CR=1 FL=1